MKQTFHISPVRLLVELQQRTRRGMGKECTCVGRRRLATFLEAAAGGRMRVSGSSQVVDLRAADSLRACAT
jgi:hypothetical protein